MEESHTMSKVNAVRATVRNIIHVSKTEIRNLNKKTNNNKNHRNPKTASVKKKLSCHWKIPCCHWEIVLLLYHNVDNDVSHCWILSRRNWMAAYLGYTLQMKTLFRGWPVMVHDMHTRRRRMWTLQSTVPMLSLRNFVITLSQCGRSSPQFPCCH